jgi:hypothetical protein
MNGFTWLFVIAGAIVLAVVVLYILRVVASRTGRTLREWIIKRSYVREARRHNKKARLLRLERNDVDGIPLPQGKEGMLRIRREHFLHAKSLVTLKQYERILNQRAEDLWILIESTEDVYTGDTILRWEPRRERRPREVY